MNDIRYAVRMLVKAPAFTAIAVLTLALGIGATTAMFSGVNAVLLRPLPFDEPDRLLFVWETFRDRRGGVRAPDYLDWQREQRVFERLAAFAATSVTLTDGGESVRYEARRVAADYFRVLGVAPVLGRDFTAADEPFGAPRTVLISDALWRTRFESDPAIVHRTLLLDGQPATVIGVLPPAVALFEQAEQFYLPLALTPQEIGSPGWSFLRAIAKRKADVSQAAAQAAMDALARRIAEQRPASNAEVGVRLQDMHAVLAENLGAPMLLFLVAVGALLLIACANVANLQLVRAAARQREVAIRAAIGASRGRIARQLLIESSVLSACGGLLGLLFALWASDLLVWLMPDAAPRLGATTIDWRVLLFAVTATMLTGCAFGLPPAWRMARRDLRHHLHEGGRGAAAPDRHRISATLVVAEIALALVLLIGAGLLVRSFLQVLAVDPGFRSAQVLTLRVALPPSRYADSPQIGALFDELLERMRALPGVTAAGGTAGLPLRGRGGMMAVAIDGRPASTRLGDLPRFAYRGISPGYFAALSVPMLRGRAFTDDDRAGRPRVAIVNQTAARRYWPNGDALGARLQPDDDGGTLEIVGVVADVKQDGLTAETVPELFVSTLQPSPPYWNWTQRTMDFVVRTTGDPVRIAAPIRALVRELDATLPVYQVMTLDEVVRESVAAPRSVLTLVAAFATIALLLAVLGLYGVMAFIVRERTHEIGVRLALGAARRDIMTLVLGRSVRVCLIGLAIGLVAAAAVSRYLATFLFGIAATDVTTYAVVCVLLFAVAMLATCIPARRAMRLNPLLALRAGDLS